MKFCPVLTLKRLNCSNELAGPPNYLHMYKKMHLKIGIKQNVGLMNVLSIYRPSKYSVIDRFKKQIEGLDRQGYTFF